MPLGIGTLFALLQNVTHSYSWKIYIHEEACPLEVNQSRIMQRIEACSQFNDTPEAGISRFSYTPTDAAARNWLRNLCQQLDLKIQVDPVGNIRAQYVGQDPTLAPILIGSHLDSVRNGGKYDGIVGVVGALEVLSVLVEQGIRPRRSVELIVFAEEEGSNFSTTMVGSKALVGKLSQDGLSQLCADDGRTALNVMTDFGLHPENMEEHILHKGDVSAMLELHIEQGVVLDHEQRRLGVVQAIAGMTTLEITVSGVPNHAGSTPMRLRQDPMPAAAELIAAIERLATKQALPDTVATVGSISCTPDMSNVIAGQVRFTVDIRDIDPAGIQRVLDGIQAESQRICAERGVDIHQKTIGSSTPIHLSPRIIQAIANVVSHTTDSWQFINSGAVHDAAMMASITDVGMIFVPSLAGKSHCPDEYTAPEDITLGCQVLLQVVLDLSA